MRKNQSKIHSLAKPEKNIFIYALTEPDNNIIRYIGMTTVGFNRIFDHYNACYPRHGKFGEGAASKNWIYSLRKKEQIFGIQYIEYFDNDGQHVDEAEKKWIKFYKNQGIKLLNHESGGRYLNGHVPEEIKKIRIEKIRKTTSNPEFRQKRSEDSKKLFQDNPELKENFAKCNLGRKKSNQVRKNMSKGQKHRIILKDSFGNIYQSMPEAAKAYEITTSTIHKYIQNKMNNPYGVVFQKLSGGI